MIMRYMNSDQHGTSRTPLIVVLCKRFLPSMCDLETGGTKDVGWKVDGSDLRYFCKRREGSLERTGHTVFERTF